MHRVHYFTDCARDTNGIARLTDQTIRSFARHGMADARVMLWGVDDSVGAGFCAADIVGLDLRDEKNALQLPLVVMGNAAPRADERFPNGSPFGYAKIRGRWAVGTVAGHFFSMMQKLAGEDIEVMEWHIPDVAPVLAAGDEQEQQHMIGTQFRSLYFLPEATAALVAGKELPAKPSAPVLPIGLRACYVDQFGNIKTSVTRVDLQSMGIDLAQEFKITLGDRTEVVSWYEGLAKMPKGELGVTFGSSGWTGEHLLEVQVKGGPAAARFAADAIGQEITFAQ